MSANRILAASMMSALLAVSFIYPAGATLIVSPSPDTAVEGNGNNGFPFNLGNFGLSAQRYEQIYAASEFGSSPLTISALAFRPDASFGAAFSSTLPSITIKLSSTAATIPGNQRNLCSQ